MLVGLLIAASPPSRWARKQGVLIIVLSGILITFGIGLAPMLTDSYFAGKAQNELNSVSRETERANEESNRQLRVQMVRIHREEAATEARIREFRAKNQR